MSKVRLYGSTSGYVDLAAPAVADDATLTLPTGANGFGKVLQVVSTTKTDTFTTTSSTFTTVTGLTVAITPTSASSKVLVVANVDWGITALSNNVGFFLRLSGGGSDTYVGDAASSRVRAAASQWLNDASWDPRNVTQNATLVYLSSPATTSSVTYEVQARRGTTGTVYVNRTGNDSDNAERGRTASSITVMEVAA